MKVIIDLPERTLKQLAKKAKEDGRSRKNLMEVLLTIQAEIYQNQKHSPNPKTNNHGN